MNDWKPTLVKIVSILAVLTLILMFNANNFDESEIKVLTWFGGFLGIGGLAEVISARKVVPALLAAASVLAGSEPCEAGQLFGRVTRQSSACANGQCSVRQSLAAPTNTEVRAGAAEVEQPMAGAFSDRERKIVERLDGSRRAVLNRLRADDKLRERFAVEWNRRYEEKVNAADWRTILEVVLKYLPQVLEILFLLLKS